MSTYCTSIARSNGPMQHYVGFTDDLERSLDDHRNGTACGTTRRAFSQGIGFALARTWEPGSRQLERHVKDCGPVNYCPLCPRRLRPSELARARSSPSPDRRRVEEPAGFSQGLPKAPLAGSGRLGQWPVPGMGP